MYYHSKKTDLEMDDAIRVLKEALATEGFGVLMELDIRKTLKEKTGEDIQPYVILGACNPSFALRALRTEDKIGTLFPCNVIVQKTNSGKTDIAAVDPVASLSVVGRPELEPIADVIKTKLLRVIHSL